MFYIGDKIGATALLIYGSLFPDKIKEKITAAVLISPLVEMRNSGTILSRFIGRHPDLIWKWKKLIGFDKFLCYHKYQKPIIRFIANHGFLMLIYIKAKELIGGKDKELTPVSFTFSLLPGF